MEQERTETMSDEVEQGFVSLLDQLMEVIVERDELPETLILRQASPQQFPYRLYYVGDQDFVGGVLNVKPTATV